MEGYRLGLGDPPNTGGSSGQAAIQLQDEGVAIGGLGLVTIINFVGSGVTATAAGAAVTVTIPGGGGGSTPTGTGFRHVTGGVEDGTAQLVSNADVAGGAAIALSKLAGVAASGSNSDITAILGLLTALSVGQGGTGATTGGGALTNFGLSANGVSLVTAANYAAMRVLLGLVIGTDVDAFGAAAAAQSAAIAASLQRASNLSDLASPGTALTNLGLSANGASLVTAANYAAMRVLLTLVVGTDVAAQTHATQHKAGGSDAIKLDELAAPTNVTTLDATSSAHGLLPKLSGLATDALLGDGSYGLPNSPTRVAYLFEDFVGGGQGQFQGFASGSGASLTYVTAAAGHDGLATLATGTTTTGRASLGSTAGVVSGQVILGEGVTTFEAEARLNTLSDATDTYTFRVGIFDIVSGESTDGCFFRYTHGTNSGKWECVTRSNSSETATDSGITADTSFHRFSVIVNAAGTSVDFYVDGVLKVTTTTNIPTGATRATGAGVMVLKSAGTTSRTFDVDYGYFRKVYTTPR